MDLDSIISTIEGKKPAAKTSSGIDIDAILKDFGIEDKPAVVETSKKVVPTGEPRPPISGVSKEASDEINYTRAKKGLPADSPVLTSPAAYEQFKSGKEMFSSGVEDLGSGRPYKGLAKTALGALGVVGAPVGGILEDTVGKYGNKIGPGFGDRAAIIASGAVPVVPGAGAISKAAAHVPLVKSLSNYTKNKSFKDLVEAIGPENIPMVVKEMRANPRLTPADLSPRVLQDTQSLFVNDGKHINYLKNTSDARMATRKSAMEEAYDASAGPPPISLVQKIQDLADAAKKVGSEQINPLVKAAKPVDVTQTIANIDSILKPGAMAKVTEDSTLALPEVKQALSAARGWLTNGKELRTGAEDLHDIQKAIRRQGYSLTKSGNAGEREIGYALLKVRNDLVSDIDKASPGYAKALENYRDEMHIADAFKQGHDKILTSSKKIENDPSFVKKWFDDLSEHEQKAVKEGIRAAVYTEMGAAKNAALAGESIARSDFNKAKMEIILGKEEANTLFKALDDERKIANTHNKVIENSQTAMRMASKDKWAMPTPTEAGKQLLPLAVMEGSNMLAGGIGGVGTALYTGARVANAAKDAAKLKVFRENQAQYAKLALPVEGPSRDQLIQQLEALIPKPKMNMLNKVRASLPSSTP